MTLTLVSLAPADWPPMAMLFLSPPKLRDVLPHPFERKLLIEDAVVAKERLGIQRRMRQKAKEVQAVVDGDDDGVAQVSELAPVIVVALAVDIAAAMNPEDDRQLSVRVEVRREDVEIQAVFVDVRRSCEHPEGHDLRAGVSEPVRHQHGGPFRVPLGRHPAQTADGRLGVGNAKERRGAGNSAPLARPTCSGASAVEAPDRALIGLDPEWVGGGLGLMHRRQHRSRRQDRAQGDACFH